MKSRLISWSKA